MAAINNLEDLPELVMDKITSFLNHKQLLALEQVSRKLKCAVDAHFSLTDHLIIGSLPELTGTAANDTKCLDGFHKAIIRCGYRLRIIQITVHDQFRCDFDLLWNYSLYFEHIFASHETSDNCPNIENIIASPKMYDDSYMVQEEKVLLHFVNTEIYANNIKASTGESCKLRGISLIDPYDGLDNMNQSYERILNLYSNLEQIAVCDYVENFYNFLPQFIENGLKDLNIYSSTKWRDAKKYCDIGKNLRTLHLELHVTRDDVAAINKLHLPKNVKLRIVDFKDLLPQLSTNICNSIIKYVTYGSNASTDSMIKLKNVEEFGITDTAQLKVIAEETFPELKRISTHCSLDGSECETYFIQLLTNKGNQLTVIDLLFSNSGIAIDVAWKALKHCTAAKSVRFECVNVDSPLSVTTEDMRAICHLPNLQHFVFVIFGEETCPMLRDLMETTVKEFDFQFKYKYDEQRIGNFDEYIVHQWYSLCRIHF